MSEILIITYDASHYMKYYFNYFNSNIRQLIFNKYSLRPNMQCFSLRIQPLQFHFLREDSPLTIGEGQINTGPRVK
jgi:hypothetical protein